MGTDAATQFPNSEIILTTFSLANPPVDAYISTGGFAKEKVVSIISEFGNCVAASVPMAFATAVQDGRIKRGNLLLFIGTGAGLSAACALIKY
jgi:3-oxoacyl-[acyl-carrier-protein] synthase III